MIHEDINHKFREFELNSGTEGTSIMTKIQEAGNAHQRMHTLIVDSKFSASTGRIVIAECATIAAAMKQIAHQYAAMAGMEEL